MVASRCLSGRPVMKITATPLNFAASNSFRAGSIASALDLSIHRLNPHGPTGSTSQEPSAMKPKSSAARFGQLVRDVSSISSTSAEQRLETRQRRDDVLDHSVGKIFLLWIAAHVDKR